MQVDCYWNFRKKQWSILHKGKLLKHLSYVRLDNVQFIVRPGGRARVLRDNRKNVHAYARGKLMNGEALGTGEILSWNTTVTSIRYNPYENETFVTVHDNTPVHHSDHAILTTTFNVTSNRHSPSVQIY